MEDLQVASPIRLETDVYDHSAADYGLVMTEMQQWRLIR